MNLGNRKQGPLVEWYTPAWVLECARAAMGGIDIDPCTSEAAQELIQAKVYHTAATDGLVQPWEGRAFLNPPYRRLKGRFCQRLAEQMAAGNVTEAVCVLSLNMGKWFDPLRGLPHAEFRPRRGIEFWTPLEGGGKRESTAFLATVVYFGPRSQEFIAACLRRVEGAAYLWQGATMPEDIFWGTTHES